MCHEHRVVGCGTVLKMGDRPPGICLQGLVPNHPVLLRSINQGARVLEILSTRNIKKKGIPGTVHQLTKKETRINKER